MTTPHEIDDARAEAFLAPLKNIQPASAPRLRSRRRASRALGIAFATLVVTGTAVAAVSGWNPLVGDTGRGGEPSLSDGPIPARFTEALGVLRKPARPIDRSAAVRGTLHGVGGELVQGLHLDSVRYLADAPGDAASIAFYADRSEFPIYNVDGSVAYVERRRGKGVVCVYSPLAAGTEHGEAPSECFTLDEVLAGGAIAQVGRSSNGPGDPGEFWAFGLVPDGVARVEAHLYPDGSQTVAVRNNFFELHRPGQGNVQRTTWRDAKGRLVPIRRARISARP